MRRLVPLLVTLSFAPAALGSYWFAEDHPRVDERVVEGHTVFAVVEATFCDVGGELRTCGDPYEVEGPPRATAPFPDPGVLHAPWEEGVLWFNDQRLTDPSFKRGAADGTTVAVASDRAAAVAVLVRDRVVGPYGADWRYPCGGRVLLTDSTSPDPRDTDAWSWTYRESYRVTDVEDRAWIADRYTYYPDFGPRVVEGPFDVWVASVFGTGASDPGPGGAEWCAHADHAPAFRFGYGDAFDDTTRLYNAVLWLPVDALVPRGATGHGDAGRNDADTTGCQRGTEWECPSNGRDGNSHAWGLWEGSGPLHAHTTADVAIYFVRGASPPYPPTERAFALDDRVGSASPWADRESVTDVGREVDPGDPTRLLPQDQKGAAGARFGVLPRGDDGGFDACLAPEKEGRTSTCAALGVEATPRMLRGAVAGADDPEQLVVCRYDAGFGARYCQTSEQQFAIEAPPGTAYLGIQPIGGSHIAWRLSVTDR